MVGGGGVQVGGKGWVGKIGSGDGESCATGCCATESCATGKESWTDLFPSEGKEALLRD